MPSPRRRRWLKAAAVCLSLPGGLGWTATRAADPLLTRPLPSGGGAMPVVGLGSWITFNVGHDPVARDNCADVIQAFFEEGGQMIDSSPMYGSAQEVIGHGLARQVRLGMHADVYAADKVWTTPGSRGPGQVETSRRRWGIEAFDLLQVHNLQAWQDHLPMLFEMKRQGRLRHVGITTSEGRRHREIESIMATQPLDFVQVSYNLLDREVEQRILPLAQERGIGVIVNRPFRQGALLRALQPHPVPAWAKEIDCDGWAQVALKFIVSHAAVTCVIPATTRVAHLRQNMGAGRGPQPDAALRRRMAADVSAL